MVNIAKAMVQLLILDPVLLVIIAMPILVMLFLQVVILKIVLEQGNVHLELIVKLDLLFLLDVLQVNMD
jgi:hypothetical protein